MTLLRTLLIAVIIPLYASTVDVSTKHVSCPDIQIEDGFEYKLPGGTEIIVNHGKDPIGHLENGKQPELSSEVIRLDNKSVITRNCIDLHISYSTLNDGAIEGWLYYNRTVNSSNPVTPGNEVNNTPFNELDSYNPVTPGNMVNNTPFNEENTTKPVLPTPESLTANSVAIALAGALTILLFLIIGFCCCCFLSWKKKIQRQGKPATISGFFRDLRDCNALKTVFCTKAESSEPEETSVIMLQTFVTENQPNGISPENVVDADPSGSGEDGVVQVNRHGSVHVVSIPAQCNGADSLDHKLGNVEFQPTANGDLNIPDVDRASHHRDMNRNMRDDPGGSNGDDYVRVDIPDSEMTAEAEPLVNKVGYDQDHVNRCSATPEPDVESKPRLKNSGGY